MSVVELESKRKGKPVTTCFYCGSTTVHMGVSCPRIVAVDFDEDMGVTRVEFNDFHPSAESCPQEEPSQE